MTTNSRTAPLARQAPFDSPVGSVIPPTGQPIEDDALWALANALHSNVPEDQRPMSWSDFSPEQIERLRQAARAFLMALKLNPEDVK